MKDCEILELILEHFEFLSEAEFKCVEKRPAGFVSVRYDYKKTYLSIGTDYREKTDYFGVYFSTSKEIHNHFYDLGTPEEREKLNSLENTIDNFENVVEAYAKFIKNNLNEILKLAE